MTARHTPTPAGTHTRCLLPLLALAFASLPAALRAQAPSSTASWEWRGVVPAGGTLELRLVRGFVRVVTVPGAASAVSIVRRGTRSDPSAVRLTVDSTAGRVLIEDRYPATLSPSPRRECLPPDGGRGDFWHSDVRLEATVRVPAGVRVEVHLMDGDIDVRDVSGPRSVASNQGVVWGAPDVR
jgi:hypothetical protein